MQRVLATRVLVALLVAGGGPGALLVAQAQEKGAEPARETRAEAAAAGPQAAVVQENLDLGTVKEGEDVKATFVIENRGQAELRILRAKPS